MWIELTLLVLGFVALIWSADKFLLALQQQPQIWVCQK
jgi:hypothetical protein